MLGSEHPREVLCLGRAVAGATGTQGRTGPAEPLLSPSSSSARSLLSPQEPSILTQLLSLQLPLGSLGFSLEPSGRI